MVKEMGCTCVTISHRPALVAFHDMVSPWLQMLLEVLQLTFMSFGYMYGPAQASKAGPSTTSTRDGPSAAGWAVTSKQAAKAMAIGQTHAAWCGASYSGQDHKAACAVKAVLLGWLSAMRLCKCWRAHAHPHIRVAVCLWVYYLLLDIPATTCRCWLWTGRAAGRCTRALAVEATAAAATLKTCAVSSASSMAPTSLQALRPQTLRPAQTHTC